MLHTNATVPVLHAPADGPVEAMLFFGVGSSDEPVRLAGITHLVEHLAVRRALPIAAPHNATTDDWATIFSVTASTAEEALAGIVRMADAVGSLVDVTPAEVEHERKILAGEDRLRYSEQVPSIHTVRFGPTGPGRAGAGWAATHGISAEEVRAWVQRWFVAENAVVTVAGGPVPADALTVQLPSGRAAGPVPSWSGPVRGGVVVESGLSGAALSLLVPAEHAQLLDAVLEHEVFRALRLDAGLTYAVDGSFVEVDTASSTVVVTIDPGVEDLAAAVDLLVATVHRVAEVGPSEESIATIDAARALNHLDSGIRADWRLTDAALYRLRGLRRATPIDHPVSADEITGLRTALRAALPGLIVCVDEDAELLDDEPGAPDAGLRAVAARHGLVVDERAPGRPVQDARHLTRSSSSSTYRDAFLPGWASMRVRLDGTDLVLLPRGGDARVIDLSGVSVVGTRGDDGLTIVDADGFVFQIRRDEWWQGRRLIAAVRSATPAELVRPFTT